MYADADNAVDMDDDSCKENALCGIQFNLMAKTRTVPMPDAGISLPCSGEQIITYVILSHKLLARQIVECNKKRNLSAAKRCDME